MSAVRIRVTGSRDWDDDPTIGVQLTLAVQESPAGPLALRGEGVVIVHGDCPTGADKTADVWARNHGIPVDPHPAEWRRYGRSAGFRRNAEMVDRGADLCLAFIRNGSHGASHCADLAEQAGIPVRRFLAETGPARITICQRCHRRVYRARNDEWYHRGIGSVFCYPGDGTGRKVIPLEIDAKPRGEG